MYKIMEKHPYRDQIIAMAMLKAIDPMPLRLVSSRFQKLDISRKPKPDLDPDDLSRMKRIVEKSGAEYFAAVPKRLKRLSTCSRI